MQCPVAGEWIARLWKLQSETSTKILRSQSCMLLRLLYFTWVEIVTARDAIGEFALLQSISRWSGS